MVSIKENVTEHDKRKFIRCSVCGTVDAFCIISPERCIECKTLFPDFVQLMTDTEARMNYYLKDKKRIYI
jgi:hypothetical protein